MGVVVHGSVCSSVRGCQVVVSEAAGKKVGAPSQKLWERKASCLCHIHQCNTSRCVKRLCIHTSMHTCSRKILCNKLTFAAEHTHAEAVPQNNNWYSRWVTINLWWNAWIFHCAHFTFSLLFEVIWPIMGQLQRRWDFCDDSCLF